MLGKLVGKKKWRMEFLSLPPEAPYLAEEKMTTNKQANESFWSTSFRVSATILLVAINELDLKGRGRSAEEEAEVFLRGSN